MKRKRYHWLSDLINTLNFTVGAEIGAATGNTTSYLLSTCPTLRKLYIVDNWIPIPDSPQWNRDDMEDIFRKKLRGENRIQILKGTSWEQAERVKTRNLDFAFVDASHDKESVMKDLKAWVPKVKIGGVICGHDLHFPSVVEALNEIIPDYQKAGVDNCWFYKVSGDEAG